jgi:dihydroorotase
VSSYLIKNGKVVNEGKIVDTDILISGARIEKIAKDISDPTATIFDAAGLYVFPGAIDDQVHFREPGLTHKGEIFTESRAAVAGGITSFMEMPNTVPNTLTQELLEQKYHLASQKSAANYSFFMGVSNDNYEQVMKTDRRNVSGIKIFMGSSTGNMLVDKLEVLERVFANSELLIATHCEDETTIKKNLEAAVKKYGENIPVSEHPNIRSREACYLSSSFAVDLAKKNGTRLHILHISTADELNLFTNTIPRTNKRITAEACIHHLWFDNSDYEKLGMLIKWNPAIKTADDGKAILEAVIDGRIDVIATDHAPHTKEEKSLPYIKAPSGGPLVQHAFVAMLELHHEGKITLEAVADKMAHAVSDVFQIEDRGYIREGYFADLVLVNLNQPWTEDSKNLLYKCQWTPFHGQKFQSKVKHTFVNGIPVYSNGVIDNSQIGKRLVFSR